MVALKLDHQQAELIATAGDPIDVFDPTGRLIGWLHLADSIPEEKLTHSEEDAAELARRLKDPHPSGITTEELLTRLRS